MSELVQPGMECSQFEGLLSEAIEGSLSPQQNQVFQAHAAACDQCGPLYLLSREGFSWLKSLDELEPPARLLSAILAATSGEKTLGLSAAAPLSGAGGEAMGGVPGKVSAQGWQHGIQRWFSTQVQPGFAALVAGAMQPRFAMSFGMAFFSITLMLNVGGVQMKDLRHIDLRPSAVSRQFYATQARVVKYYENLRFVYEFQARVQDLKKAATTPQANPAPADKKKPHTEDRGTSKKDSSGNNPGGQNGEGQPAWNLPSPSADTDSSIAAITPGTHTFDVRDVRRIRDDRRRREAAAVEDKGWEFGGANAFQA